jgi:hypothetical protein
MSTLFNLDEFTVTAKTEDLFTPRKKFVVIKMAANCHLRKGIDHEGRPGYYLYAADIPKYFFRERQLKKIMPLLKVDKKGNYTFNLNKVKTLHGNCFIRRQLRKK